MVVTFAVIVNHHCGFTRNTSIVG